MMKGSYLALGRPRRPRGIKLRVKRCATQVITGIKGRVSRALTRCYAKLRKPFRSIGSGSGYVRVIEEDPAQRAPKGHLTVYVGPTEEGVATKRVVVPVIYFNHPLFRKLLEEAEEKFGFDHPGGITIPCPVAEFETIKSKIAAGRA